MRWNWQHLEWPNFQYNLTLFLEMEKKFLLKTGEAHACLKVVEDAERKKWIIELLCNEGLGSSKIEGEILDRESLQSSIRKRFGLQVETKERKKEARMAEVLFDVYENFSKSLSHEMLFKWHDTLFKGDTSIDDIGKYRTHSDPMQIISNRLDARIVHFEAPPSSRIPVEMNQFIEWFNGESLKLPILIRAATAHLYFESIHPFEDGNGRIGRLLVDKILSQGVGYPLLIAISSFLEKRKKDYYRELEIASQTLVLDAWIQFFLSVILASQEESLVLLEFLLKKNKLFHQFHGMLNVRQEKVLLKIFGEGPSGFQGGLSAEKYIKITKTSKATATRDLIDLVEKGILYKTGELRHTRYWLK